MNFIKIVKLAAPTNLDSAEAVYVMYNFMLACAFTGHQILYELFYQIEK